MGIDARMMIRTARSYTEVELRQISGAMCAAIGKDKFFIMKPAPNGAFSAEYLAEHYGSAQGRHTLTIERETVAQYLEENREWLEPHEIKALESADPSAAVYGQDGPPMIANPGEQFINVHLWTRYYGKGYERGSWPTIRGVAEYLEHAFPGATVYYGGDSSGVCATPFDEAARKELNDHYLTFGHSPYRGYRAPWDGGKSYPTCDFCGGREMNNIGGRGGDDHYQCDGCGDEVVIGVVKGSQVRIAVDEVDGKRNTWATYDKLDAMRR